MTQVSDVAPGPLVFFFELDAINEKQQNVDYAHKSESSTPLYLKME
jgi:hypothetical protein